MSDQQSGPDWWQASDGKWYPPTLRPGMIYQPLPIPHGLQPEPLGDAVTQTELKKKNAKWKIAAGAFVALMVIGAIGNATKEPESKGDKAATKDAAPAEASSSEPETTSAPATSTEPTTTAAPTTMAAPTTTAAPTATLPQRIELTGSGDLVIEFPSVGGPIVATIGHTGRRNFIVKTSDNDLLVNTIGNYLGTVLDPNPASSNPVEVRADGAWTISITGIESAPLVTPTTTGTGSAVLRLPGDKSTVTLTHSGSRNFVVRAWDVNGTGRAALAVNEIGAYQGTVILRGALLEITADGAWTLTIV